MCDCVLLLLKVALDITDINTKHQDMVGATRVFRVQSFGFKGLSKDDSKASATSG